ncbi:hypothetical protein [Mucilaginibacter sp.]
MLLLPGLLFAQHKKHPKKPAYNEEAEIALLRKHYDCFYTGKYSVEQRNEFYPFNTAGKIQLLSFMQPYDRFGDKEPTDGGPMYVQQADSSYAINESRVVIRLTLGKTDIDSLTNILYNYGFTPIRKPRTNVILINEPNGCYEPRSALLFLDVEGKVKEYIEYCFSCQGMSKSSQKISGYVMCNGKYEMLRQFFFNKGLTFGIRLRN